MTVSTSANSVVYRGNGAATQFAVPFKVLDEDHLVVTRRDYDTGEVLYTYIGTDYTYSGIGDDAGTLTLAGSALADTYELVIERIVPYTQDLDIVNAGGFYPETVEEQLDLITMGIQQLADKVDRGAVVPVGEEGLELSKASDRANTFFSFDAAGQFIASSGTGADAGLRTDLADPDAGAALVARRHPGSIIIRTSETPEVRNAFDFIHSSLHNSILAGTNTTDVVGYLQDAGDDMLANGGSLTIPGGVYPVSETWKLAPSIFNTAIVTWPMIVDRTQPLTTYDTDYDAAIALANKALHPVNIECQGAIFAPTFTPATPTPVIEVNTSHWRQKGRWGGTSVICPLAKVSSGRYAGIDGTAAVPTNNLIGFAASSTGLGEISGILVGFCEYGIAHYGSLWCFLHSLRADNCKDAFHLAVANACNLLNASAWYCSRGLVYDGAASRLQLHTQQVGTDYRIFGDDSSTFDCAYLEDVSATDGTGDYSIMTGVTADVAALSLTRFVGLRGGDMRPNKKRLRLWGSFGTGFEGCREYEPRAIVVDTFSNGELNKCDAAFEALLPPAQFQPINGLTSSATWDPGSLADGVGETSAAIACPGARLGDTVLVGAPYDLQGICCNGYVSATDEVKVRLQNETTGTIDLASGTWRVRVFRQTQ